MIKELGRIQIEETFSEYNIVGTETVNQLREHFWGAHLALGLFWLYIGITILIEGNFFGLILIIVGGVALFTMYESREFNKYGNKETEYIQLSWIDGKKKWTCSMEYKTEYSDFVTNQEKLPIKMRVDEHLTHTYWCYKEVIWKENEHYTNEQIKILLDNKEVKKQKRLEKEKKIKERRENPEASEDDGRSRRISQKVKDTVWNRDGGKCVECGSNKDLEFDHIIPFSEGGANTYRNIQLLCEHCNRSKSNKIG